jgi:signal transduction histidine kinase
MAISLARTVDRAGAERERILHHSLMASDLERRRIAHDLHDGVIQDLAGLGYALPSIGAHLSAPGLETAYATLQRTSQVVQRDVEALRSMLTDIYPPELDGGRLATALEDLARRTEAEGIIVTVRLADALGLSDDGARLVYRVVREALHNVLKHACATVALVEVLQEGEHIAVRVTDDGTGLSASTPRVVDRGHMGLRLLEGTLQDFGGTLTLADAPGGGAVLEAVFPVDLTGTGRHSGPSLFQGLRDIVSRPRKARARQP